MGTPGCLGWSNFRYPSVSGNMSNVSEANGATITAQNTGGGPTGTWTGGVLSTGRTVDGGGPNKTFRYGFFEAYAKLPSGGGVVYGHAFWLVGNDGEIDIMEFYGFKIANFPQTLHYSAQGNQVAVQNASPTGDWTQAYHLFQVLWTPSAVTFYIDNVETASYTAATLGGIPSQPMMIMLNFDVGGVYSGAPSYQYPNSSTPTTAQFNVAYVRVYQQS